MLGSGPGFGAALNLSNVVANQSPTNQFFVQNGAKVQKFNDRVFIAGATYNSGDLAQNTSVISSLTNLSSTLAQATVPSTAGLISGQQLTISGATGTNAAQYNISAPITITSGITFTYPTTGLSGPATGSPIYTFYASTTKDWLYNYISSIGGFTNIQSSEFAILSDPNLGAGQGGSVFLSAVQSKTFGSASQSGLGIFAIAVNNNATFATNVWAFYGEAYKQNSTVGSVYGMELDIWSAVASIAPTPLQQGDLVGIQLAVGAQVAGGQDGSAGIQFAANPNKWKAGINFLSTSLSNGLAIALFSQATNPHTILWTNAGGFTAGKIYANNTLATFNTISFENGGLTIRATDNAIVAQFAPSSGGVNYAYFPTTATTTPVVLQAAGTDTNISIQALPKGTGAFMIAGMGNFANDAAAAAGGVPIGGLYRITNAVQIRLV
jgi:hypothetical protein